LVHGGTQLKDDLMRDFSEGDVIRCDPVGVHGARILGVPNKIARLAVDFCRIAMVQVELSILLALQIILPNRPGSLLHEDEDPPRALSRHKIVDHLSLAWLLEVVLLNEARKMDVPALPLWSSGRNRRLSAPARESAARRFCPFLSVFSRGNIRFL
jgi:hypothetical protein